MPYFDHAAATPLDDRVLAAMQPYFSQQFYNPSATYAPARLVADALRAARAKVAHHLGARPGEVVFVAGGTEANNLAVHGVMRRHPDATIVVSAIEHDSVLHPAEQYDCKKAPVTQDGFVDLDDLQALIDDRTVLVSVMYANNEIGTIQPLRDVSRLLDTVRAERRRQGNLLPLYFHTDACQAANYLDLHAARLGIDLLTVNGGKIYGPKQSAALYVKAGTQLEPLVRGGGQEAGLRSGTENVAACIGLATALELAQTERQAETKRLQALQRLFVKQLAEQLPQARINGSMRRRLPNNIHLTVPGSDNERLLLQLESDGILAAAGSACSASSGEPSHVLRAIGLCDDLARASLRFSTGRHTDEQAVVQAVQALVKYTHTYTLNT